MHKYCCQLAPVPIVKATKCIREGVELLYNRSEEMILMRNQLFLRDLQNKDLVNADAGMLLIRMSIHISIQMSIHMSIHLSIHLSIQIAPFMQVPPSILHQLLRKNLQCRAQNKTIQ